MEIYFRDYTIQGSDFSSPMLLAINFMLNGCGGSVPHDTTGAETSGEGKNGGSFRQFGISPWILETKNTMSFRHRTRTVVVPDVDPTSLQHHCHGRDEGRAVAPEFTMLAIELLLSYYHFLPNHHHPRSQQGDPHHHNSSAAKERHNFHAVICSFFLNTAPSLPHFLLLL